MYGSYEAENQFHDIPATTVLPPDVAVFTEIYKAPVIFININWEL